MRGKRSVRALALAMLLLAAVATTASPAAAKKKAKSVGLGYCGLQVPGAFDSLSKLTRSGAAARGDEGRSEPGLSEPLESMPASATGKGGPGFKATIPVWFHVVSPDGRTANLTSQQIQAQMTVLNMAFAGFYGGANTGFSFRLAGVTRTTNADWFANSIAGEKFMKQALHRGGAETLNIYSTTAGPYLGWAYLPGLTDSRLHLDGVVADWESMPNTSPTYAGKYDLGFTVVHEVGHWLNLEHVFYGGCNANGDFVADTPAQKIATRGCPVGQDSCTAPGVDSIHNYMDYSYDSCYFEFTVGQAARMQDAYLWFRG